MEFLMHLGSDIIGLILSVLLLAGYHYYLWRKVRRNPGYTIQALNSMARTAWVEEVMANKAKDVMAVQTLRNSTMAATFLASTAVLLIIGTLTLSGQGDKLDAVWHQLNIFGAVSGALWATKLLLLVLDFLIAFLGFAMSVRLYNHVGYLINVPSRLHDRITPHMVARHLNLAGRFYSLGMRAYYFAVPLVFWLFGPHFMLAASVILVIALYYLDRAQ
jgi:uncharacterized membrane protein